MKIALTKSTAASAWDTVLRGPKRWPGSRSQSSLRGFYAYEDSGWENLQAVLGALLRNFSHLVMVSYGSLISDQDTTAASDSTDSSAWVIGVGPMSAVLVTGIKLIYASVCMPYVFLIWAF